MTAPRPMTPAQRDLARHALGLPNRRNITYRNFYAASYHPGNFDEWAQMVDAGLAERSPNIRDGLVRFWLTKPGALAALNHNENLCSEDFD